MNLHGIVKGAIAAVNPLIAIQYQISTGYTIASTGRQVPSYASAVTVRGQLQPLTFQDLQHLDGMNIQGSQRAIYTDGTLNGILRPDRLGGDLVTLPDGTVWLTTLVLEQWPDWVKVAVTRQNEP